MRKLIETLKPYEPKQKSGILLNANENYEMFVDRIDINNLNRYPDSNSSDLRSALSNYLSVSKEQIIVGNGSSEMIEIILKTMIEPGDKVLSYEPTFVMYKWYTELYNGIYNSVPLKDNVFDVNEFIRRINDEKPKVVFLCNPNNPTGMLIPKDMIEAIIKNTEALIVVDEAYIEFSGGSMINRIEEYDNLIVLRTFSKAFGLAAARVGYMVGGINIINNLFKTKSPYNLNQLSQKLALQALENKTLMVRKVNDINLERERLYKSLVNFNLCTYKSFANFIYFEGPSSLGEALENKGIIIRSFGDGKYRVTVGTKEENNTFLEALIDLLKVQEEQVYETSYLCR
jgi:histidinol-phosphate aminotransferase